MLSINTRPFMEGEQGALVRMFEEVLDWPGFDHQGSGEDYWQWKYLRRVPSGFSSCAGWIGDRPVSHASVTASVLMIGGNEVRAGQLGDLYTHPDQRGAGLAEKVLSCVVDAEDTKGTGLLFAFPTESGRGLLSKRGCQTLRMQFTQYQLITNTEKFFSQMRMGTIKRLLYDGMLTLRTSSRPSLQNVIEERISFPDDVDEMTLSYDLRFDVTVRHSTEYLNWRYADPAGGRYRMFISRGERGTNGLMVLRPYTKGGTSYIDIIDIIYDPSEPQAAQDLLFSAVVAARNEGADGIQIWLPSEHPVVPMLVRSGFLVRNPLAGERMMTVMYRVSKNREDLKEMLERPGIKAHIMLGDTDWL